MNTCPEEQAYNQSSLLLPDSLPYLRLTTYYLFVTSAGGGLLAEGRRLITWSIKP
jgi:hypothetical protein